MAKTTFIGTYRFRIDRKGRVSVPADFRAVLAHKGEEGLNVLPWGGPCVRAIGNDVLAKIAQAADPLAAFNAAPLDNAAILAADLIPLSLDAEGRVTLPESLVAHCSLGEFASFAGRNTFFEIWNPEALEAYQAQRRAGQGA
ncbi:MAG: division/cell wall cluster transcriptional repressor MraZ [Rhodospirillales bacterium]|nr:division/cell wall cluster transcriptional repressor MraZ [Rhodospirillales bacterium]